MARKKKNKVLSVYINSGTRTVSLLDEFEELDSKNKNKYDQLRIVNSFFGKTKKRKGYYYELVIERSKGTYGKSPGNITFTEFKQKKTEKLEQYISKNITDEILEEYGNRPDLMYRFENPFILRAQNSKNRTGYGWEWDWRDGNGYPVVQGTEYGESTQYIFAGVYLTKY